jgi:hypothetical protein
LREVFLILADSRRWPSIFLSSGGIPQYRNLAKGKLLSCAASLEKTWEGHGDDILIFTEET